jgi:hypothetical protein
MLDKNINKNINKNSSTNSNFNFDFSFNSNKTVKNDWKNCIYCKCKNDNIKILKKQNEERKEEIINKNKKIQELEEYINDLIGFSVKYNINNIDELKYFIKDKSKFISDEIMYIDIDIFQYECEFELKEQINYYEKQIDTIDNLLKCNNINSFSEFKTIICKSNLNYKYDEVLQLLDKLDKNIKHQKFVEDEIMNNFDNLNIKIKNIKNKLSKVKEGDIITFKGIKRKAIYVNGKLRLYKIENVINKIKMLDQDFNNYCHNQIKWARSVIGNDYPDDKIIKLLDILNKLVKDNSSSDSETGLLNILHKIKIKKNEEYQSLSELGLYFINNNINNKNQISKEELVVFNETIKSYDLGNGNKNDKMNRFISTSKRIYKLSQKINIDNIIKSKCQTNIRDMTNTDFDNLLKLLDNFKK